MYDNSSNSFALSYLCFLHLVFGIDVRLTMSLNILYPPLPDAPKCLAVVRSDLFLEPLEKFLRLFLFWIEVLSV